MDKRKKITVLYNGKIVGYLGELEGKTIGFQYNDNWIKTGFSIPWDRIIFMYSFTSAGVFATIIFCPPRT